MRTIKLLLILVSLCVVPVMHADTLETVYFRGNMSPANEVPPVTNESAAATGKGTIAVHIRRNDAGEIASAVVDFDVDYNFPVAVTVRGLHIHEGGAGVNGPIRLDTGLSGTNTVDAEGSGNLFYQVTVTGGTEAGDAALAAVNGLLANPSGYYVNLHTSVNPGGLFRDQLARMERVVVRADMNSQNEVPPIAGLDASGEGAAEILFTRDATGVNGGTVRYYVNYRFPGAVTFTGLHIHPGAAGATGPARLNTALSNTNTVVDEDGSGSLFYKVEVTSANDLATLGLVLANPANAYMNLHTSVNPGGAIRGQLQPTAESSFQITMTPANEVPPIEGLDASALAKVSLFAAYDPDGVITSGTVIFDANYTFPGEVIFRGFHIHDGVAGVNGPVRIDSGLTGANTITDPDGVGNLLFRINVGASDPNALATLRSLVVSPENHYLNLHTSVNPGGAIRAQLAGAAAAPTLSSNGIVNATFADGVNTAAPGSLVSIFGTNLARSTTGAVVSNGRLATTVAGTQVRFGGIPAPLLFVSPGQINAQVPFESAAGSRSVVINTPAGSVSSTDETRVLQVSAVAPAIFAVAKVTDFSVITAGNPVEPNEPIAVFATGLGRGSPPVATGQLPPVDPLSETLAIPTATIGGINAEVLAHVLAPGLAGVNQVNVVVPPGAPSGSQTLQLSVDGVLSNAVTINVQ